MSKYSGKCDIGDWFSDKDDEYIRNSKFYIYTKDGRRHKLDINSQKDLLPYYPYLVCVGGHDSESSVIDMSSTSFCDSEEEEHLNFILDIMLKVWRRCKRKKEKFTREKARKEYPWNDVIADEVINKVLERGANADTEDIHTYTAEYYRKQLAKDMIKAGYTEKEALNWVYNEGILGYKKAKKRFENN